LPAGESFQPFGSKTVDKFGLSVGVCADKLPTEIVKNRQILMIFFTRIKYKPKITIALRDYLVDEKLNKNLIIDHNFYTVFIV